MGKLIIAICLVILYKVFSTDDEPVKEEVKVKEAVTQQQKDLLNRLIVANGHSCNRMTRVRQSSYDGNWTVFCGEESAYDIEKSGSFWKVTKKY